jgi:hypothetical protein
LNDALRLDVAVVGAVEDEDALPSGFGMKTRKSRRSGAPTCRLWMLRLIWVLSPRHAASDRQRHCCRASS